MSNTTQNGWYVLQVLSTHEKKVKRVIEENRETQGMQDLVQEVLLPTENVMEMKEGKQKILEKRLWPGYLLVKMFLTDESWMYVKQTNGVIDFLGGGSPTPLTDREVEQLQQDLRDKQTNVVQKQQFAVGDKVKVIDGVFINFLGTIIEVNNEKGRVNVMVSIFGRETRVDDLEFWQIEEASEEDEQEPS
mgnify:CR=1 FL=1|jgi:transcription termination/antitermination protein NusG